MGISIFIKTAALGVAAALLAFALYGTDMLFLAKGIALALGFSIVFTVFYPYLRGIRKGDRISVNGAALPRIFGFGMSGFALSNGALNDEIRIQLDNGKEAVGIVESYESTFSLPRVRILYEEKLTE